VVGIVLADARGQRLEGGADAARLVDRQLLGDRQVHRQVQEGIRLAAFDGIVARHGFVGVFQLASWYSGCWSIQSAAMASIGVRISPARRLRKASQKKAAHVVGRGGEHGGGIRTDGKGVARHCSATALSALAGAGLTQRARIERHQFRSALPCSPRAACHSAI
jgi:hypothetical protein